MQRYFVHKKEKDLFYFEEDDSHHIKTVMRMNIGDSIEVVYQSKLYIAELISLTPMQAEQKSIINNENNKEISITLAQSLVKEQKMDLILQKSTELGIDNIIPIQTERSLVKIKDKEDKKVNRWQKIVKEASEQSKRISIPYICYPLSVKDLSKLEYDIKILCSVNELSTTLDKVLSSVKNHDKILFVVGPEGGFTKNEEQLLIDQGFISTSLGSRVLRTETVSLYIMSVIQYLFLR